MANRMQELLDERNWSLEDLADEIGRVTGFKTSRQQMHKLKHGDTKLTVDWMEKIAAAFDVGPAELLVQKGAQAISRPKRKSPPPIVADDEKVEMVQIVELDVRASAGFGAVNEGDRAVAEWSMPRAILRAQTSASPSNIRIITVYGTSMIPDFSPGDRVMVDVSDRLAADGTFVVLTNGAELIKYLKIMPYTNPARVRLISKNETWGFDELDLEMVEIKGRVIGKWLWT